MSQFIEWLEISGRHPGLQQGPDRNKINVSVKGPLYAASAVFERRVAADGHWEILASADATIPLKKKWNETVHVTGNFSRLPTFEAHTEKISSKPQPILWQREDQHLALNAGGALTAIPIDLTSVPVASSADLFFLLQDVWQAKRAPPRGLFTVAAQKLYAVRLESRGAGEILGQIGAVEDPNRVSDWSVAFRKSLEAKAYDFTLGWSEADRSVTGLEVKVPVFGRVRAQFK